MPSDDRNKISELIEKTGAFMNRILAMPNDSRPKTLFVAASLCLVCSVIVSAAAVVLKPQQLQNSLLEQKRNILSAAGLTDSTKSVEERFERVETKLIDIRSGEYVDNVDPADYDQRKAAKDPKSNIDIPRDDDLAQIHTQAQYAKVYLVRDDSGAIETVVLPVHGYGLWSTLYGFLALASDANTVVGLSFFEHAETPGLGGEVDNPKWKAKWKGKKLFDPDGDVAIQVIKGTVAPEQHDAEYKIDGLAGATLTSRGVGNLVRYWVGQNGFGPYLEKLKADQG